MDASAKLELFAGYMGLEPTEEHTPQRPVTRIAEAQNVKSSYSSNATGSAGDVAACGHSPAELQSLVNSSHTIPNPRSSEAKKNALGISYAAMPGGKRIALLKTLLTSACERDCYYCPFRAGRDFRRATFKSAEMAAAFMSLHQSDIAQGFFLSSGIAGGGVRTQDQLIDTADILRSKLNYRGYLHLKIMPGAERAQVQRMMQLSDRVSINLEAPNAERLSQLAPHKSFFDELLRPLQWVEDIRKTQDRRDGWNGRWPSSVTQLVVGGADETDLEIMSVSAELYKRMHLARVYYSAFHPMPGTPLENHPAEAPMREFRLYQSSFLLRDYGFDMEELPFEKDGNLPREIDPKIAWARTNLSDRPVEINQADRNALLRVPGIGPKGVNELLMARRKGALRDLRDLQKLGIIAARAAPFVLLNGRRPTHQLELL